MKFVLNGSPSEFVSNEAGDLTHVVVNGEQIEADVCVLGVGVEATTEFLVIGSLLVIVVMVLVVDKVGSNFLVTFSSSCC